MITPFFQLDAFTTRRFAGNPAAVVVLDVYPEDAVLQHLAAENNLAETAFLVRADGGYRLRWFTPVVEVPLCGHATLASGAVVMERLEPGRQSIVFDTASGPLTVTRRDGAYAMDLPARPFNSVSAQQGLVTALGVEPVEAYENEFTYLVRLESELAVRSFKPDLAAISQLPLPGVIVTATSKPPYDFVSRYFAPAKGVPEDSVTGAAHCTLAPYWAKVLKKSTVYAFQASQRGGEVACELKGDRVVLIGTCVFYLEGAIEF